MHSKQKEDREQKKLEPLPSLDIQPRQIYGFDIETVTQKNKFYCAAIVSNHSEQVFYDPLDAIEFMVSSKIAKNNPYFCATNLKFDFFGILKDLDCWERSKFFIRNGRVIQGEIFSKDEKYKACFLDTLSFYPASVEKLGNFLVDHKLMEMSKMEKPKTFVKDEFGNLLYNRKPKNKMEEEQLEIYNIQDAKISMRFMQYLQDMFVRQGCKMKYTIGGTAMDLWRRVYQTDVYFQEDYKKLKVHYSTTAKGGISLAYARGTLPCDTYDIDINSMYPWAMTQSQGDPNTSEWVFATKDIIENYHGTTYCEVTVPKEEFYPLLGYKYFTSKTKYELLYPTGTFRGWYNNIDLQEAYRLGYEIKPIGKSICYKKECFPHKEFVEELYDLRNTYKKEKNPAELAIKLEMNNQYGKHMQKIEKVSIVHFSQISKEELEELLQRKCKIDFLGQHQDPKYWFWKITDPSTEKYPKYIMPQWSTTITARGRVKINQLKRSMKGITFNVDTDGIVIPQKGNDIEDSNKLGDFKIVGKMKAGHGCIVRPKMYYLDSYYPKQETILKAKGIKSIKSVEEFFTILEEKKASQTKFYQFAEMLKAKEKIDINEVDNSFIKEFSLNDSKRFWFGKEFDYRDFQISAPWHIIKEKGNFKKVGNTMITDPKVLGFMAKYC